MITDIPQSTEANLLQGAIALCKARLSVADLSDVRFLRAMLAHLESQANDV